MTDTISTDPDNTPDTPDTDPDNTPDTPDADPDDYDPPTRDEWERLREKAATRERLLREAQAKIKKLSTPADRQDPEPTEADKLRAALTRTAGVSVLAGAGITDKADQDAILSIPGMLSGLDVSDDGTVDTDALADRLDTLRRVFAPKTTRTVRPVDTKRGQGDPGPSDPDKARYNRIMGRR